MVIDTTRETIAPHLDAFSSMSVRICFLFRNQHLKVKHLNHIVESHHIVIADIVGAQ